MLQEQRQGVPPQEDLNILHIAIPSTTNNAEGVTFYNITATGSFSSWSVAKRYSQFEELYNNLSAELGAAGLPRGVALPPKKPKLLVSHSSPAFIEERRVLLENLLRKLLTAKETRTSHYFLSFMTSDRLDHVIKLEDAKAAEEMPEDVEVTDVSVPSTRTMSDHVLYQVDVSNARKRKTFSKWTVLKRYVQFYEMDAALREEFADDPEFLETLPQPPDRKVKLLVDHMEPSFIEERRVLLEAYLQKMIKIPRVVKNSTFLHFLGVNV
jgi:hypothetical protein